MTAIRAASDRAKHRLMRWCEQEIRAAAAERMAAAILAAAPATCTDPFCSPGCPHHLVWRQALADAALVREMGGVT